MLHVLLLHILQITLHTLHNGNMSSDDSSPRQGSKRDEEKDWEREEMREGRKWRIKEVHDTDMCGEKNGGERGSWGK